MNEYANSFAKQQADLLRQSYASLYDNLLASKDAAGTQTASRRDELLAKIDQSRTPINDQYLQDTRAAYVNKMMSGNKISELMNRMQVSTGGFGVGEQMKNEAAYGQNYTGLTLDKNRSLQDLTNQEIQAQNTYNTEMLGLETDYLSNKMKLDQYVNESATSTYNTAYANYMNEQARLADEKQRQFENEMARKNYELSKASTYASINSTKPQNYTNQPAPYTLGVIGVPGSNGTVKYTMPNGDTYSFAQGVNPWTGQTNPDVMTNGVYDPSKAFNGANGGYQPNEYQKSKLSKVSAGKGNVQIQYNGQVQNVWQNTKGKYVFWDGRQGKYLELTNAEKKALGIK